MRLLHIITIAFFLLFSMQAGAGKNVLIGTPVSKSLDSKSLGGDPEKKWYYPYEISDLNIKQANDGTGVIRDIYCGECDFKIVKITPKTKVYVNGDEVELLRARERAGKDAFIEFDKETAEVQKIIWSE